MFKVTSILLVLFGLAHWGLAEEAVRSIKTYGHGEIAISPDQAEVKFSVEVRDKKLARAEDLHAKNVDSVEFALKEAGFKKEQIFTTNRRIEPIWRKNKVDEEGFKISQNYVVRLSDVAMVKGVLHAVLSAGVSRVSGVKYRSSREKEHERKVLALAAKDAQARAQTLADSLGASLGRVLQVEEDAYTDGGAWDDGEWQDFGLDGFGSSEGIRPEVQVTEGLLKFQSSVRLEIEIQ